MKICGKCKEEKDEASFYKCRREKDGLAWQCKSCEKKRKDRYYQENKEDINRKNNERRNKIKEANPNYSKEY